MTDPEHGSVAVNADGTLTYQTEASYTGTDVFEYTVVDGRGGKDTASVSVAVLASRVAAQLRRDECRDGGWEGLGYRTQGLCMAHHGNHQYEDDAVAHEAPSEGHSANRSPWPMKEQWDARLTENEATRGTGWERRKHARGQ